MRKPTTSQLITASLLLAIGIIFPMIFHSFGLAGPIFLPMHIPVLLGGFVLAPQYAVILGLLTPLLSSLFTGMPVLFPIAIVMMIELALYGLTASILFNKINQNNILSLIVAMIIGRIGAAVTVYCLVLLFKIKLSPILFIKGAITTGLPGITIQVILIPILVGVLKRIGRINK